MTETDILQLIGSAALFGIGLIGWRVSLVNGRVYARFGREALTCVSAMLFGIVFFRMADLLNLMSPTNARTANGMLYLVTLLILLFLALHVQAQRSNGTPTRD